MPERTSSKEEKIKMPDFTVLDADDKAVKLSDFFESLYCLGQFCPPCKEKCRSLTKHI